MDITTISLLGAVLGVLTLATIIGHALALRPDLGVDSAILRTFNARVRAWWLLSSVLIGAFLLGRVATVVFFGLISFRALREFITLTPTRRADHRALFWVFVFFTPLQFLLVAMGERQYGLYSILIPVYAFLFIPARVAVSGDYKRFLERSAKIQCGLMICVYCLSFAPAVLNLEYSGVSEGVSYVDTEDAPENPPVSPEELEARRRNQNTRLLLFLVVISQVADALQYLFGKWFGRRTIAPSISPSKTWEGLLAGIGATGLVGALLAWGVVFNFWQAAVMAALISLVGAAGSLTMSAIKRDRGVRDYGIAVEGHGGILDRIDSLCFASPIFFHITQYFFTSGG